MKTAADELREIKKYAHMGSGDLGGRAAEGPTIAVDQLLWYQNAMRDRGDYDYKRLDPRYDELGNFNYGAMGIAFEFTVCLRKRSVTMRESLLFSATFRQIRFKEWG